MLLSKGKEMNDAMSSDFAWDKPLKRKNHEITFTFITRVFYPLGTGEMWLDENKLGLPKVVDDYFIKAIEKCSKKIKKK
jgi:hypothetical protein